MLGGARSGKSRFAQDMAGKLSEKVLFVATAEALDKEMQARIEEHRRSRDGPWRTIEAPRNVGVAVEENLHDAEVVLVDCLTLLVSNVMTGGGRESEAGGEQAAIAEVQALINTVSRVRATCIVVSNEVGLGLVPDNALGRVYRDVLGKANQMMAASVDDVYFLAAGIPLKIKG